MTNRLKAYLMLILTAAIWGFAAPIVKYTLEFVPPVDFLFYRFILVSAIFVGPFLISLKKTPIPLVQLIKLFLIGILGGPVTLLLIFFGANRTTSLDASLIVAMAPVLIVVGGAFFLKEKVTRRENLGLAIALCGTLFTIIEPLISGSAFAQQHLLGNILTFSSNIAWAAYVMFIKKLSKSYSPLILTATTFFSGLLILTPLFFYSPASAGQITIPPQAFPGVIYMALFSSVIAYTTYNWGVALIEASEATVFTYLQPVFAAPLAFFWLKEAISRPFLIGVMLIAFGVFLTEYHPRKTKTS